MMVNFKNMKYFMNFVFVLFLMAGCQTPEPEKSEELPYMGVKLSPEQMKQITLDTVKLREDVTDLPLSGRVDFNQDDVVPVFGFVSGNVLEVNASLGDHVSKGQVLALLRSGDIGNYLSQFDQAKGQVALTKRNLDVAQELYTSKVYSELEVLNAKIAYEAAKDNLTQIQTYLKTLGVSDSNKTPEYKIVAPTDGYIVAKAITKGMNVLPGSSTGYFTISSLSTVWVKANIYESDYKYVKVGDSADVHVFALSDTTYKGMISKIAYVVDSSSGTMQARIVLNNSGGIMRPNMLADIIVHLDMHKKAIAVPKESLVLYNNIYYIMLYRGNNTFEKRAVKVEGCSTKVCYISEGIKTGDILSAKGSLYVLGQ